MGPPYYSGALDHPTSSLRGPPSPPANRSGGQSSADPTTKRAAATSVHSSHARRLPFRSSENETEISPNGRRTGRPKRRVQEDDDDQDDETEGDREHGVRNRGEDEAEEDDIDEEVDDADDDDDDDDDEVNDDGDDDEEEEEKEIEKARERQQVESPPRRSFSQRDASTNEISSYCSPDSENHKRPRLLPSLSSSFTNNSLPPLSHSNTNGEYYSHPYPSSHSPNPNHHLPLRSSPSNVSANSDRQQQQHRSHHTSDQLDKPPVSPVVLGFQLTSTDPNTRDSILSALKLKEQQQALIQQRKGTPRNEKEYKKRGPGSNPSTSSRARAKARKAGENSSAEPIANAVEEDRTPLETSQSSSRSISAPDVITATATALGPELPPVIRSVSTSNLLPPPSTFVAYSQSPPRTNSSSNVNPNSSSQLPSIDHRSHQHPHSHHPNVQDKSDESLAKWSDGREAKKGESERSNSGGSVGRAAVQNSELAQSYSSDSSRPAEGGAPGSEQIGGKPFSTSPYPSHMAAPSHHLHNQQQHPHYSALPPPPPPHHTHPPQPAHLLNGRTNPMGNHQHLSIAVQQNPESTARSGPQGGYGINGNSSGSVGGGPTAPSPSYLQTSFSSSSSSSSSGRAPPPAPLAIHSSHHRPSPSYPHHQQHQHQQGSSLPSPVPYGYPTSGMASTPSGVPSTAPPKATFLAPFERFYDALVDSRTLQSTMSELTARSAEMNRRADEAIHRVEDHHRRCVSVLNTLQASSTSLQDMVRKEVYVVREEFSRELDSVWRRVHTLEAAFKTAGLDVPGGVPPSGSTAMEAESEPDREKEIEKSRQDPTQRGEYDPEPVAPTTRADESEVDELESETEETGDLGKEDQGGSQAEDGDVEDVDDEQNAEPNGKRGLKEDGDVEMDSRNKADDDNKEEVTTQAPAFTTTTSKKPRKNLGSKTGRRMWKGP